MLTLWERRTEFVAWTDLTHLFSVLRSNHLPSSLLSSTTSDCTAMRDCLPGQTDHLWTDFPRWSNRPLRPLLSMCPPNCGCGVRYVVRATWCNDTGLQLWVLSVACVVFFLHITSYHPVLQPSQWRLPIYPEVCLQCGDYYW